MSTFSGDIGREEEDGGGWGGLVPDKEERAAEVSEPWYFTFGFGQHGGALKNRYVRIMGTVNTSREEMFRRYGAQWAMQYRESEFLPQITKFGLTEIE